MFEARPPLPPSTAQLIALKKGEEKCAYLTSVKQLLRDKDYSLLLVSFGLNIGVFYAFSTLLNQELLAFPVSLLSLLFIMRLVLRECSMRGGVSRDCSTVFVVTRAAAKLASILDRIKILLCVICLRF